MYFVSLIWSIEEASVQVQIAILGATYHSKRGRARVSKDGNENDLLSTFFKYSPKPARTFEKSG
jgi:hypothetical protein